MGWVLKLVVGNLAIFLAILVFANLAASIYLDLKEALRPYRGFNDKRIELPVFPDKEHARTIFSEIKSLRTRYVPYIAWSQGEFHGEAVNVDAFGERQHEATTERPVGHVMFFGGSTTWGLGVDDEGTIPARFNALHPDWRVHNHGELGFNSRQELARLINLANQGAPMDLVVFYDGYNDVRTLCQNDVSLNGHSRQGQIAAALRPASYALEDLTGSLRQVVSNTLESIRTPHYEPSRCLEDSAYGEHIADVLVRNWRIARAVAQMGGADFIALLQPVAAVGKPNLTHLADDAFSLDDYAKAKHNKLSKGIDHKIVYPILKERIAREGVDWIHDITDVFDGEERYYMGPSHVIAAGNQRVAERISDIVVERLNARVRSRSLLLAPRVGARPRGRAALVHE